MTLIINEDVWPYLTVQRGDLSYFKKDRAVWTDMYEKMLDMDVIHCLNAVPNLTSVLDIGSGVGAIDVYLAQRTQAKVFLLDGEDDKPSFVDPSRTYNSRKVTESFMKDNGVEMAGYFSPTHAYPHPVDLILSLRAWCMFFPPHSYLSYVKACCKPTTRLIIDIRGDRKDWFEIMCTNFRMLGIIASRRKHKRVLFEVRQ